MRTVYIIFWGLIGVVGTSTHKDFVVVVDAPHHTSGLITDGNVGVPLASFGRLRIGGVKLGTAKASPRIIAGAIPRLRVDDMTNDDIADEVLLMRDLPGLVKGYLQFPAGSDLFAGGDHKNMADLRHERRCVATMTALAIKVPNSMTDVTIVNADDSVIATFKDWVILANTPSGTAHGGPHTDHYRNMLKPRASYSPAISSNVECANPVGPEWPAPVQSIVTSFLSSANPRSKSVPTPLMSPLNDNVECGNNGWP